MERINKISEHPLWKLHMTQLKEAEKDRIFCKHGIEHLLDVARIAYIENLEQNCGVSKERCFTISEDFCSIQKGYLTKKQGQSWQKKY